MENVASLISDKAQLVPDDTDMPIKVSSHLHGWLQNHGLENYLQVTKAEPHPDSTTIIQHIDAKLITNKQVRRFFNLKNEG